ncbi:MAG TPA: hypothetical protein DCM48_20020, partial [Thalassospira sp.]|nr:hypothetical protein [Thalassospira sp.]
VLAISGLEETGAVRPTAMATDGSSSQSFGADPQSGPTQTFGLGGAVVPGAPTSSGGMASATVMPN